VVISATQSQTVKYPALVVRFAYVEMLGDRLLESVPQLILRDVGIRLHPVALEEIPAGDRYVILG